MPDVEARVNQFSPGEYEWLLVTTVMAGVVAARLPGVKARMNQIQLGQSGWLLVTTVMAAGMDSGRDRPRETGERQIK